MGGFNLEETATQHPAQPVGKADEIPCGEYPRQRWAGPSLAGATGDVICPASLLPSKGLVTGWGRNMCPTNPVGWPGPWEQMRNGRKAGEHVDQKVLKRCEHSLVMSHTGQAR